MNQELGKRKNPPCTTGVEGLDDVLCGGLPSNRCYLIQGEPGVGKTTLALQFLLEGARLGEPGLYVTFSETKEELEEVAHSHGWGLDKLHVFELTALEERLKGETETTFFHPAEMELSRTTKALLDEVERVKPKRVVFDSVSEMRLIAETPLRYRRQLLQLKQFLACRGCTVLLLDDSPRDDESLHVGSLMHGVIALYRMSPPYGVSRRQLSILKVRGVKFREGYHDMVLRRGGLVVFPRLVAAEHHAKFKRESFPSGIKALDELLGGGLDRGTSNMFLGPPGTGKTTLAIKFAHVAAERGEKVLFFVFDETVGTMMARAAQLGMALEAHVKSGLFCADKIDPADIAPGEFVARIRGAVQRSGVRMVILDSLNGFLHTMPDERFLDLHLHELLAFLNRQGVITIMLLAQQGLIGAMQSVVDLTYLADTVLLLRYFEARGEVRQAVSIIKKRSGNHERSLREMKVGKGGLQIGAPLTNMQGVLTGVPAFTSPQVETDPPFSPPESP